MKIDRAAVHDLLAEYGALIDLAKFDEWLDLFAEECRYQVLPRQYLVATFLGEEVEPILIATGVEARAVFGEETDDCIAVDRHRTAPAGSMPSSSA